MANGGNWGTIVVCRSIVPGGRGGQTRALGNRLQVINSQGAVRTMEPTRCLLRSDDRDGHLPTNGGHSPSHDTALPHLRSN